MQNTVEELVGHDGVRELPKEGLQEDGGGVDLVALEGQSFPSVDLLYELLHCGSTGRSPIIRQMLETCRP